VTEGLSLLFTVLLLLNSLLAEPNLLLIYVVSGLFAAVSGLRQPAMQAALPRLVDHEDMAAAAALMSFRWQLGVVVGPTIGGVLIATYSVAVGYAADIATFVISMILIAMMKKIPPSHEAKKPSLAGLIEGIKYAYNRKDLLGTYLVDLAAMFFCDANCVDSILGRSTGFTMGTWIVVCRRNCWFDHRYFDKWLD